MKLHERILTVCGDDAVQAEGAALRARCPDAAAVREVVAACREARAPVSVEGLDLEAEGPAVFLDLSALDGVQVDAKSHLVQAGAGVSVAKLEGKLREHDLTLGWQSLPEVAVGTWLAAGDPGPGGPRALPGWSPVMALEAVLLDGTALKTTLAPRSATGPDLKALLVGGRGKVGVITSVTLRVHERPAMIRRLVFAFPEFGAALNAVVEALGRDLFPDRLGVMDGGAAETVLTWESQGEPRMVGLIGMVVDELCGASGGRRVSTEARASAELGPVSGGAAGPEEVRARCAEAPGLGAQIELLCRWSRVTTLRRSLLEGLEGRPRLHLSRALPEGVLAIACVPGGAEAAARTLLRSAGAFLPGEEDEGVWYAGVGTVLRGGRGEP